MVRIPPKPFWSEVMMELLGDEETNTKLSKNEARTWGLSLAPADSSGYNVCPWSTLGCRKACVAYAGMNQVWASIHEARVRKTKWFFEDRQAFLARLDREIGNKNRWCAKRGMMGYMRLNMYSDLGWEHMLDLNRSNVRFYDYTKSMKRAMASLCDSCYRLIYSYNETSNPAEVRQLLEMGGTMAMVRADIKYVNGKNKGAIPATIMIDGKEFATFDADEDDNRYLDPKGAVGILRLKGNREMRRHAIVTAFAQGTPHPSNLTSLTVSIRK